MTPARCLCHQSHLDWNLLLDDTGGPNHVGNLCSAPMLADTASDTVAHQNSYYYIGHFARFVKPGARRVLCAASRQDLEAAAFVNPDGTVATVVMNRTWEHICFALSVDGRSSLAELPPRSIATYEGPQGDHRQRGRPRPPACVD